MTGKNTRYLSSEVTKWTNSSWINERAEQSTDNMCRGQTLVGTDYGGV